MFSSERLILLAVLILTVYYIFPKQTKAAASVLESTADTLIEETEKAVDDLKDLVPPPAEFGQESLREIPQVSQTGPPGFGSEGFTQQRFAQCDDENFKKANPALCFTQKQSFTQDAMTTVPPVAASCPSFSDQVQNARFQPKLTGKNEETMNFLGDENPYHSASPEEKSYDWENSFQNDVQSAQILSSIENDPSRKFVSTPPQATKNSSIRADAQIAYDPAAACILSSSLTRLQSNQGL